MLEPHIHWLEARLWVRITQHPGSGDAKGGASPMSAAPSRLASAARRSSNPRHTRRMKLGLVRLGACVAAIAVGALGGCFTVTPGSQGGPVLGGGAGSSGSAQAVEDEKPLLGACVESPLVVRNPFNVPGGDLAFEGTVRLVGAGLPEKAGAGSCPFAGEHTQSFGDGSPSSDDATALAQISWVSIERDDGVDATLAVVASGFAFPARPGERLSFSLHTESPRFSPVRDWLEVRDASGALLLWIASAGDVAELRTPAELVLTRGDVDAQRSGQCVTAWTEHRLEASMSGIQASVASRERGVLGSYQLVNGSVLVQTGTSQCPDAFVAFAQAAMWPLAASVPLTDGIGGPCSPELFGPGYSPDPGLVCLRDSQFPLGYLTRACSSSAECPKESTCDGALCRAACRSERECPWPAECLPAGELSLCQCGERCAQGWCDAGLCGACPDDAVLGTTYFSEEQSVCMSQHEACPDGLERFDELGCGCGCRLPAGASCVGELPGARYTRGLGGCTPSCGAGELPYSEACGCGCAPGDDPAVLCSPPPDGVDGYVAGADCSQDCPDGTRTFNDACGCVCAGTDAIRTLCLLDVEPGPCLLSEERYYYEPLDDSCKPFSYGGCLGNLNNFSSREACEAACVPWP
jgi:trypsin inhibitor